MAKDVLKVVVYLSSYNLARDIALNKDVGD